MRLGYPQQIESSCLWQLELKLQLYSYNFLTSILLINFVFSVYTPQTVYSFVHQGLRPQRIQLQIKALNQSGSQWTNRGQPSCRELLRQSVARRRSYSRFSYLLGRTCWPFLCSQLTSVPSCSFWHRCRKIGQISFIIS